MQSNECIHFIEDRRKTYMMPMRPDLSSEEPRPQIRSPIQFTRSCWFTEDAEASMLLTIEEPRVGRVLPSIDGGRFNGNDIYKHATQFQ